MLTLSYPVEFTILFYFVKASCLFWNQIFRKYWKQKQVWSTGSTLSRKSGWVCGRPSISKHNKPFSKTQFRPRSYIAQMHILASKLRRALLSNRTPRSITHMKDKQRTGKRQTDTTGKTKREYGKDKHTNRQGGTDEQTKVDIWVRNLIPEIKNSCIFVLSSDAYLHMPNNRAYMYWICFINTAKAKPPCLGRGGLSHPPSLFHLHPVSLSGYLIS